MADDNRSLEERKLKEIEHSRVRRSILRGYERTSDTNLQEEAPRLKELIRDEKAFKRHFSNIKFYSVAVRSAEHYQAWLRQRCPGAKALDYCCGNGENAIFMAKCGADVIGIDISPEGIENARLNAIEEGVEARCKFEIMDGEAMTFADNTFDVIVAYGVLHHLDFDNAMSELSRVLRPDGGIIAIESLRHNPIFHLYRKMTMHLRTQWEFEHILTVDHLNWARKYFAHVDARFFHLAVMAAVPFRKTVIFRPLRRFLDRVDEVVLRAEAIGKYGWMMVFTLGKPRKAGAGGYSMEASGSRQTCPELGLSGRE